MNFAEYQEYARRTMNTDLSSDEVTAMLALGVAGEGGEVADYIKKVLFHKTPMDKDKLVKELGDVLWYVANLARHIGVDLEDVAAENVRKLERRYPKGFTPEDSVKRADGEVDDQEAEWQAAIDSAALDGVASCAGCGRSGSLTSSVPPGDVALHWVVRGVSVCIDCYNKSLR